MTGLFAVRKLTAALLIIGCLVFPSQRCASAQDAAGSTDDALFEEISRSAFLFFVHEADAESGLVRDKTGVEYCSIASVGFGLAAMPIAAERGWIDRNDAQARTLRALRTLARSSAHHQGVFCHYIDLHTGQPTRRGYEQVASTIDTALLMAGVITAGQYFSGESETLADDLFTRINWRRFLNPDTGWVVGYNGTILQTMDGGKSWTPQVSAVSGNLFSVRFLDENTGWITASNGALQKTTNGGQDWNHLNVSGTPKIRKLHIIDSNKLWAIGGIVNYNIPMFSTDGGDNWTEESTPSVYAFEDLFFLDEDIGWMVGWSGEILKRTGDPATAIEANVSGLQYPEEFRLLANYPNPFNPRTVIAFNLSQASQVRLDIFNILGQHVLTLAGRNGVSDNRRATLPAGRHEYIWNGKNEKGYSMTSGMYFYRLSVFDRANNRLIGRQTSKMLMIK